MSRTDLADGIQPPGPRASVVTLVAKAVSIYAAAAALWIWGSDAVLARLALEPQQMLAIETWKGWAFVAVTSALLWVLMSRLTRRVNETSRLAAEHRSEAARSAALLSALSEGSTDAIFAKDLEGRYLLFNREAARLAGRSVDEVLGQDDRALFGADAAVMIRANDQRVTQQGKVMTFEEELAMPGGETKTFLATKGPLRDAQGTVIGLFGIARDISEMVRARRQLEESERRWRELFESNPQPMCVFDVETLRILAANDAALDKYGWTRDEFLAMSIVDVVVPEDREALRAGMARRESGTRYGVLHTPGLRHCLKDGRTIVVDASSNDIDFGGRHARLMLAVDVTGRVVLERERETALRALRRSEQRYRLAAAGGHVWDWDIAAGLTSTPPAFWQRLGIDVPTSDQAVSRLEARMHPDDVPRWRDAMHGHLVHRRPYDLDYRMQHADGSWRSFHTQGQAVWDETGRATYMAGTTFDVTDQRRAEASLLASQQELTELSQRLLDQERETTRRLAQALHDRLGQTLGSTRLYLDVALQSGATPPAPLLKASELVDTAVAQVRDVLVELRPPLLEAQGLAHSLRDEVRRQAVGLAHPHVEVDVDPGQAEHQRWPEAVEYAAFMVAREAVTNALLHAGARHVRVELGGSADRLALRVRDDGVGIGRAERDGRPGHLGIVGMRERAVAVGARLSIDNLPEGGTAVQLRWHQPATEGAA